MTMYSHKCSICGNNFFSTLLIDFFCFKCFGQVARTLSLQTASSSSSATIPQGGGTLAASFFQPPRASDVKARGVTYINGVYKFREEYR